MTRRIALVSLSVALALTVAACSGSSSDVSDTARKALAPVTTTTTRPSSTTTTAAPECDLFSTEAPMLPLPTPGDFEPGTALHRIHERDYLLAGIDENTPDLGERDPRTAEFKGLEVELVHRIAAAIFGDPDKVRFKTVVTKEKNDVVENHDVDLTASADSITCPRKLAVDFSSEYLRTGHVLLVRTADEITDKAQLDGRPVCVTAGSSSVGLLAKYMPKARPVEVDARNDCLVALQQGDVDAYLGHTTFVRGMRKQDPDNMSILPGSLNTQHYGIAVSQDSKQLTALVNGVLQQMREDGTLADLFRKYGLPACEIPPADPASPGCE